MNNLLEIIGPYPPPLGGISIHIARMEFYLKEEKINYKILNHGFLNSENVIPTNKSAFWYIRYLFKNKGRLVHFHQFFIFHFFYYYVFSKLNRANIIITIHSEKILYSSGLMTKMCIGFLKRTRISALICVSKNLSGLLKINGLENICLPAVVPPNNINTIVLKNIPRKQYFLYSIWKLNKESAESIYNIELAMGLLAKIQQNYHMLFLIGTEAESDKHYLSSLIEKYSVSDSITTVYEGSLVSYLKNCKFFLRTNNIDGYGVSIQEALYLKVPAIASDVCVRPKGSILFKKGDLENLYEKVKNLDALWKESEVEITDYHVTLLGLYKKYLQ